MRLALVARLAGVAVLLAAATLAAHQEPRPVPAGPPEPVKAEPAKADPPAADSDIKVSVGQLREVVVTVKKDSDVVGYRTTFDKDTAFFRELKTDNAIERVFMFQSMKPGTYTVVFWTQGGTRGITTRIVVGDGKDGPVVDPITGKTKIARVVIIRANQASELPTTAHLVARYERDAPYRQFMDQRKYITQNLFSDARAPDGGPPKHEAPLIKLAEGKTYPQYFVVDGDYKPLKQGDLPTNPADMIKILKDLE
jgi:hypothetical protein